MTTVDDLRHEAGNAKSGVSVFTVELTFADADAAMRRALDADLWVKSYAAVVPGSAAEDPTDA